MTDPVDNNLLAALAQWATRQDENFLTEAFVHLLRHVLAEEPECALQLIGLVTGMRLGVAAEDVASIEVCMQTVLELGRPDVEIRFPGRHLVYLEAKVESGLGFEQLKRYRQALNESGQPATTLVLLSRYSVSEAEVSAVPDVWLRWFQIGDLLAEMLARDALSQPESRYIARQFVGFLRSKGMLMDRVSWEMTAGVRALTALLKLLLEAVKEVGMSSKRSAGAFYTGYYLNPPAKDFWVGVYYDSPNLLWFQTDQLTIDPAIWSNLGVGEVKKTSLVPCGYYWRRSLDLEAESVHFFARTRGSQQNVIESFLRECIKTVGKARQGQGTIEPPDTDAPVDPAQAESAEA